MHKNKQSLHQKLTVASWSLFEAVKKRGTFPPDPPHAHRHLQTGVDYMGATGNPVVRGCSGADGGSLFYNEDYLKLRRSFHVISSGLSTLRPPPSQPPASSVSPPVYFPCLYDAPGHSVPASAWGQCGPCPASWGRRESPKKTPSTMEECRIQSEDMGTRLPSPRSHSVTR